MATFDGRLFGPGLPGAGVAATAGWQPDGSLHLSGDEVALIAAQPQVAAGGFNAATLRLTWEEATGGYAFCIDAPESRAACLATAPAALAGALAAASGAQQRVARRFRLGWALLASLLLLPLLALGLVLLQADRLADWAVARIPLSEEARLGDLVLAQTRLQTRLLDSGPAVDAVRGIGEQLSSGSLHRYRWFVAEDASINAFAAPGGVVVVNRGLLLAVGTPEELAGVLAHEIAHAELRHSLRALVKSLGLRAVSAVVLGDYSGSAVAEAAKRLTELGYSRAAEREADRDGLRRLVAARIDPQGLVRFFERLQREQAVAPPAFLSTHPDTAERIAELQQQLSTIRGDWQPLAVDLAGARAALAAP